MNSLRICYWNANGLSQHKHEVQQFLTLQDIDLLLVSETHFTQKNCFRINGYYTYDTKQPNGRACGGTAILVRKDIKHFPMPEYRTDHIQATSINIPDNNITISSIYCPPRYSINRNQFLDYFATLGPRFIAAGDYNAKHTFWGSRLTTPRGRQLFEAISSSKLDSISCGQPTYWPTDLNKVPDLIDFAVIRNVKRECISVIPSLDLSSDHTPTILTLINSPSHFETQSSCFPNKKTNWLKYKMYISSHLPQNIPLKSENEIQSAVNIFTDILTNAAILSTPSRFSRRPKYIKCCSNVESLIREKRQLRRQWQDSRSPAVKTRLNQCIKRLRFALKNQKESKLKTYLQNLDSTKETDYSLWKAVKNMQCPIAYESPIRLQNGQWAKSSNEKVEAFASHLEHVFTPNNTGSTLRPVVVSDHIHSPLKFRLSAVKLAVKGLKAGKSPGTDKITSTMICFLPNSALKFILFIFNAILRTGYFPSTWKLSEIVMIPKPGKDVTQVTSYRPISLLSIFSKLFEKLLLESLLLHLNNNNSIPNHQFGFRRKHGTIEQVHRITTLIRRGFESKQYCSALFIDISQAFDKVWHDGLIHKMTTLLPQNVHKLLKNYIINRSFQIRSKDVISSRRKISAGVPQGSILGPLLYILYTADMPTSPMIHTSTFADDTAFVSMHTNPVIASEKLQSHITELEKWLYKWKINVNASKCVHITFTLRRESCPPIRINNVQIPEQDKVRYLGIHLDRRLTWTRHIESKVTQIKLKSAQIHWLIGPKSALDLDYKVLLYKAVIKPIWLYGIQLWGTASSSNIEKLQRRQSKLLRIITGAPWYVRNSNIHKDLNIPTIREEIKNSSIKYMKKLSEHPNPLARDLLTFEGHRRLRRMETLDLGR